jgi:hypothetical protein
VAIGNPHRTTRVAAIANQEVPRRTILLLSDGAEFARYLELARAISTAARAAGLSVLLRPHPLERRSIAVREATGVDIDHEPDLYTSLSHAHVVVSEVSTGMLESAGIADRIVVWATGKSQFSFGSHPFESFESGDELARRLSAGAFGRYDESLASQVWANDWQSRYASFLSDVGVKVIGGDS